MSNRLQWDERPLDDWIADLGHPDDDTRWRAIDAVRHLAPPIEVVPLCVSVLKDRSWFVRGLALHALYDLAHDEANKATLFPAIDSIADAVLDEDPNVKLNAISTLELLGSEANATVPILRIAADDDDERVRIAASEAIDWIQQRGWSLGGWLEKLHHPDDDTRLRAINRLRAIDAIHQLAHPSQVVQICVLALKDHFWSVRSSAAYTLSDLARDPANHTILCQVLDQIANAALDVSRDVKLNAIYTLELLGPEASGAVPILRTAAGDANGQVRVAASEAIAQIQRNSDGDTLSN